MRVPPALSVAVLLVVPYAAGSYWVDSNLQLSETSPRYELDCVNCTELCFWSSAQPGCNGKTSVKRASWAGPGSEWTDDGYACHACRDCINSLDPSLASVGWINDPRAARPTNVVWDTYSAVNYGRCEPSVVQEYDYVLSCDANTRTLADWRNTWTCPTTVDTTYQDGPNADFSYECGQDCRGSSGDTRRENRMHGWNPRGLCHVLAGRTLLSTQDACGGTDPRSTTCPGICSEEAGGIGKNSYVLDMNMCPNEHRGYCAPLIPELRLGPDSDQSEEEQQEICGRYAVNTGRMIHMCVLFYPWWDNYRAHCGAVRHAYQSSRKQEYFIWNQRNPPIKNDAQYLKSGSMAPYTPRAPGKMYANTIYFATCPISGGQSDCVVFDHDPDGPLLPACWTP